MTAFSELVALVETWRDAPGTGLPPGCVEWWLSLSNSGYGQLYSPVLRRTAQVHLVAFEVYHGFPVPEGREPDHLCRHRWCFNPRHLEDVTRGENNRRGESPQRMLRKTHCPRGHAYDSANTYVRPRSGHRVCRACNSARMRERRAPCPAT